MRLLSALDHEGIEEYIKYLPGVDVLDVVRDKKSLLDVLEFQSYDIVLVSKDLPGSEDMDKLVRALGSKDLKDQRAVFIYGGYDCLCDDFIGRLVDHNIYDFHVGEEITSKDIERLIFKPAGKDSALGYLKSSFDNTRYISHEGIVQGKSNRFFKGRSIVGSGLTSLLRARNNKRMTFDKMIVSIISNHSTGKSHTAWNLGYCLSKRGYAASLFNIDRGYSANLYFDIDEIYYDLLDAVIENNKHRDILEGCFRKKKFSIITGKLGDEKEIGEEDFMKLLYSIRTKSDITIVDTRTGLSASTRLSIKSSTYDLLVFDCDIMHFHMNMKMIEDMKEDFVPEKTIAVINNTNIKSPAHKFIYNELVNTGIPFKDITFIRSCGLSSVETMHTGLSPYQIKNEGNLNFIHDIDSLLGSLTGGQSDNGLALGIFS